MTCKDMCETIVEAGFLIKRNGKHPTAREIFEYSSRGELWEIFFWHQEALVILGEQRYCNHD